MSEIMIRRNHGPAAAWTPVKTGKASAGVQTQKAGKTTGYAISDGLRQVTGGHTANGVREARNILQTGEAVLDELQNVLEQMDALVQDAAGDKNPDDPDKEAIQEKLENLKQEIDRIIDSAVSGDKNLFLDDSAEIIPGWLTQTARSPAQILSALGLDGTASAGEILSAVLSGSLESNSAIGYLAALYLGALITGGESPETADPETAMAGLQRLLDKVAEGVPLDEAVTLLTNGIFTSIGDFESSFLGGTAPGLQDFLINMLLADPVQAAELPSMDLGLMGINLNLDMDIMMGLLSLLDGSGSDMSSPENRENSFIADNSPVPVTETVDNTAIPAAVTGGTETAVMQIGDMEVSGKDLSGVSYNTSSGEVMIGGTEDVTVRNAGTEGQNIREGNTGTNGLSVRITGTGMVRLHGARVSLLTVDAPHARIFTSGKIELGQIHLKTGTIFTIAGDGTMEIGGVQAGRNSVLRLDGGTVIMQEENGRLPVPVFLDGPAILSAHTDTGVYSTGGKRMEPFDIIWKTMLPGWSGLTGLEVDGRQIKLDFLSSSFPARLWLDKGDPSHGYPVHKLLFHGRDEKGRPKTRYSYLRWMNRGFHEIDMYPNPFNITGGEEDVDWRYDGTSQALHILTSQVAAVSGGTGTDARMEPFSGRIALADNIGAVELTLGGVICRVASGQAFDLGRGNNVALFLRSGADNVFESGEGYAGVSLGDGTCLCIDCPDARSSSRNPDGKLVAGGGRGGAGIGRDCNESRDRTSHILIRGGEIMAIGTGGGAGIGAGKKSFMGSITITGGKITATGGKGGGAGIGAGLGAPVGNISIQGGIVSAAAAYHAAAIGAGVHGESGDILIAETARIVKAMGGDPGADIGACLFGKCGKVHIAANIGSARLRPHLGIGLQMGGDTVVLPQFRLSSKSLHLHKIGVTHQAYARTVRAIIEADRHLVSRMRESYGALYHQMEESCMRGVHQDTGAPAGVVRDTAVAETVLRDVRKSGTPAHNRGGKENMQRLFWE